MKRIIFYLFIVSLMLPVTSLSALEIDLSELKRVDPHGNKDMTLIKTSMNKAKECKSCHYQEQMILKLKPNIYLRCISCHGKSPHSGVLEHVGKNLTSLSIGLSGKLVCQSCHRSHRALLQKEREPLKEPSLQSGLVLEKIEGVPSFLRVKKDPLKLPKDLIEKHSIGNMLKRTCRECHLWSK